MNASLFTFRPIESQEIENIKLIMRDVEWAEHYVDVHAKTAHKFTQDDEGEVFIAMVGNTMAGFIALKHQQINWLTYISTLVVGKNFQRKGLGKQLIDLAEKRAHARGNRGIFLDTTDQNTQARMFYKGVGFQEAYTMPHYYSEDIHGITYLKFFNKKAQGH